MCAACSKNVDTGLVLSTGRNWFFARFDDDVPIAVPCDVDVIPLELVWRIIAAVGVNDYFEALQDMPES